MLLRVPFPILLVVFSALVFFVFQLLQPYLPAKAVYDRFWIIQIIAGITSLIIHRGLKSSSLKSGQAFIRFFMASSALKLFAFMVIMVVFALADRSQAFGFIFNFLIMYLLYTTLEVWVSFKAFGPGAIASTAKDHK